MKLFEYQAKEVFARYGLTVPPSLTALTASEAEQAAKDLECPVVLKSQVLRGGRGKAGLIQLVSSPEEAGQKAQELFDSPHGVRRLLVEKAVDIDQEIYISVTIDAEKAEAMFMLSIEGGVEIETLAAESPEKIHFEYADITRGLLPFQARDLIYRAGVEGDLAKKLIPVVIKLFSIFKDYDAELVEINPLFLTKQGELIAGDGKIMIDDNSAHRQEEYSITREHFDSDMDFEAAQDGIPYLQFDGEISLMCAGAGLTTTVYDLINYEGGTVANYLEFGGPNYKRAKRAMELCLRNRTAKVLLVVTFGTIARADVMAEGIVSAMQELKPEIPIVTCIRGTNEEAAHKTLAAAGLDPLTDTEEAVRKAVSLCRGESR
ncbi:MAG: succinate--CoA ligase subunit beta [Spirochaetales bacterium]|nr:succinate--CoA ligase subunit beta [Spirochaetales bacterium]